MAASEVASSILGTVVNVIEAGLGGIGLLAFFYRWIVPGAALDDMKKERDEYKALFEKEREAHQATRDAFAAASQRSDAGVEAARGYAALFRALREVGPAALPYRSEGRDDD